MQKDVQTIGDIDGSVHVDIDASLLHDPYTRESLWQAIDEHDQRSYKMVKALAGNGKLSGQHQLSGTAKKTGKVKRELVLTAHGGKVLPTIQIEKQCPAKLRLKYKERQYFELSGFSDEVPLPVDSSYVPLIVMNNLTYRNKIQKKIEKKKPAPNE